MENKRCMTERIKKIYDIVRNTPIRFSVEKASLFTEAYKKYDGEPDIIRTAKAQAYMLDHIPIYILPGDLIAGAPASKPMGIEADFWTKGVWLKEGIEALRGEEYDISDEDAEKMYELSDYWRTQIAEYKLYDLYDEEMWRWKKSGFLLPVNNTLEEAAGMGYACNGMAILPDHDSYQIDHAYIVHTGLEKKIQEAREELERMNSRKIKTQEDLDKVYVLRAMIIIDEAVIRWANRYADLAQKEAEACEDAKRRKELLEMSEACRNVPAKPAKNFREAFQFLYFVFLMQSRQTTTPLGRLDQVLYPFYKKDVAEGILDDELVLEYMQCYRLKIMQMKNTSGGQSRLKWSGQARWNGVTLGGLDKDGNDASNELTILFIEAAYRCRTPHHTLHLRVHEKTPMKVLMKALELVKTGIGMPSFNSDACYIRFLTDKGVPIEKARDYMVVGCVEATVPEGFGHVYSMMVMALAYDCFMHNGYSPVLGRQIGPETGDVRKMKTFDEYFRKAMEQCRYFIERMAEDNQLRYLTYRNVLQDAFPVSVFSDGAKVGKGGWFREMPYKIGPTFNIGIGTVNIGNSMAVVKRLVYEEKVITMDELMAAIDANWEGEENQRIRDLCLSVPKYGNDCKEVDDMVASVYNGFIDICESIDSYRGTKYNASGLSITAHDPGGALTGATPDGRYCSETLADGCISPAQGTDTVGPTAVINSAIRLPQYRLQACLHNMKLHPSSLKTEEDMKKLAMLIRTYMLSGGKQIQFNVVDQATLIDAKEHPQDHRDLIVRVAGYSTYFVSLSPNVQQEVIDRTSY